MAGRRENKAGGSPASSRNLFAETNRGILFDILIFLVNVFFMPLLTGNFMRLVREVDQGDELAGFALFLFCLGIFILPPLGAVLKRPHYHRRLKSEGKTAPGGESFFIGCLFNPVFYFSLNLVIVAALNTFIMNFLYNGKDPGGAVSVPVVIGSFLFTLVQTFLIYRYFSPPKKETKLAFLRDPRSELIGDICIFLNMLLFQVAWNVLGQMDLGVVSGVVDFLGRLFLLVFLALLIYFPPRIFFLAEDIRRPAAWLTILLANSPLIFRVLFGGSGTYLQN